jgi:cellulose biosynthesis protein BcsQ/tetratricopeptide (TPR) repeat protein
MSMDTTSPQNEGLPTGEVITFYSYKGGTGRSMLLANVAWQLAAAGRRVLLMDWDLEAPGLHRYFKPFLGDDPELREQEGVMQWLTDYWDACLDEPEAEVSTLVQDYADPRHYVRKLETGSLLAGGIDLMCAGRQDKLYAQSVADFDFTQLYQKLNGEAFIDLSKRILVGPGGYDYVLIDSRTGVSDTSGFCTVALADTLVVCFTYNNQSMTGASQIARDIRAQAEQRRAAQVAQGRARRFRLFAIPSRVEDLDPERLERRQKHAWSLFADLLTDIAPSQQVSYWGSVEIRNSGQFAYEEVLAACMNRPTDLQSVLGSVTRIARVLTDDAFTDAPPLGDDERRELREQFAALSTVSGTITTRNAWARYVQRLPDAAARDAVLQSCFALLIQLVGPAATAHSAVGAEAWVRTMVLEGEMTPDERRMAEVLTSNEITIRRITEDRQRALLLADDSLLINWEGLLARLAEQRDFIVSRELVRGARRSWDASGRTIASLRSMQGDFVRIQLGDAQRAWMGRSNLELWCAVQDFMAVDTQARIQLGEAHGLKEESKAEVHRLHEKQQLLEIQREQRELELRNQSERLLQEGQRAQANATRFRVAAIATILVTALGATIAYFAANRATSDRERSAQELVLLRGELESTRQQAALAKARLELEAAYRYYADGARLIDQARKSGDYQPAIDAFTSAIQSNPELAEAYRGRTLARARLKQRDISAELADWANYYDLRRSLSGRTQLIVRALTEPVVDVGLVEAQLKKLRLDASEVSARGIAVSRAADQLDEAMGSAFATLRPGLRATIDALRAMHDGEPARSSSVETKKATAAPAAKPQLTQQRPLLKEFPAPATPPGTTNGGYDGGRVQPLKSPLNAPPPNSGKEAAKR